MTVNIADLRCWIGRTQHRQETLTLGLAERFNATFDWSGPLQVGADAPLLVHLCLCQTPAPAETLGPDGHPIRGEFLPPVPLPRRMWAGGAFEFHQAPRIGETVSRQSTVTDVTLKEGRSGPLCFVTVTHEVTADGRPLVTERQDIVYRDAPPAGSLVTAAVLTADRASMGQRIRRIRPSTVFLFRYSALTFNGHRIHYDRPYAIGEEGYPGLIVHGPLQATLLAHFAADIRGRTPRRFRFRSLSPVHDGSDMILNASEREGGLVLWTAMENGPVAMEARAEW